MNTKKEIENHVVSFSGGRTSAYLVWLFEQKRKKEGINVEYIFCDTGAEVDKTYAFVRNIVKEWGINLTCLRSEVSMEKGIGVTYRVVELEECTNDLQPFRDLCMKYGTPSTTAAFCSERMKGIPFDKYCNDKYGKGNYFRWLGIRADEPKRLNLAKKQEEMFEVEVKKPRFLNVRYLAEISDFEKQDVLDWWKEQSFDLGINEFVGNCVFCVKKGANKLALAAREEPEMAKKFSEMINSPEIPSRGGNPLANNIIYRGRQSLEQVVESFEGIPTQVMLGRMHATIDSGSCSESCEAITNNYDMFEEV